MVLYKPGVYEVIVQRGNERHLWHVAEPPPVIEMHKQEIMFQPEPVDGISMSPPEGTGKFEDVPTRREPTKEEIIAYIQNVLERSYAEAAHVLVNEEV